MASGQQSFTTGALAQALEAELIGPADLEIRALEPLDRAGPGALTFIRSARYAAQWAASGASAALITRGVDVPGHDPARRALLVVPDADLALARLLQIAAEQVAGPKPASGRHDSAVVEEGAQVAPSAHIGPGCVVRSGAIIGDGANLIGQVYIGRSAHIGADVTLHPGVRILDGCEVHERTIIHANTVIGADGFGYLPAPDGAGLMKIPHIGSVRIGCDVEIGACSCVDRGKFGPTIIGDGAKIDNLVQIAHNCEIGRSVVICGQTGLSGSVRIEDGAMLGGGVGVSDNLTIGAGARIGARSGVMNNVPPGESWIGAPAMNMREQLPNMAALRKLAGTLRELRKAVKRLEEQS